MSFFDNARASEFGDLCLALAKGRGKQADAVHYTRPESSSRVRAVLRAMPGTLNPNSPGWGSELGDFRTIAEGFIESLRYAGCFDALLPSMRRLPMRSRIVAATSSASGSVVGEGESKPISELALTDALLDELKAVAEVVISADVARSPFAQEFLLNELRGAVASASDRAFVANVTAGVTPVAATGIDGEAFRGDLAAALGRMTVGQGSRIFILLPPPVAIGLTTMGAIGGGGEWPEMALQGGVLCGFQALPCDAVSSPDASPPRSDVVVVDAASIAADPGEVFPLVAEHADVMLAGEMVSLWQSNLLALRLERTAAASIARPGAVATISGAAYGAATETSP